MIRAFTIGLVLAVSASTDAGIIKKIEGETETALAFAAKANVAREMALNAVENAMAAQVKIEQELVSAIEMGVQLMSDTQVDSALQAAGLDQSGTDEALTIYSDARVNAFRSGIAFLMFIALASLILSTGLSNRMLVETPN